MRGNRDIVQCLLSKSADPNAVTKYDARTPLHEVAEAGSPLTDIMLRSGAKINAEMITGDTPLHIASRKGHIEVVLGLWEKGANLAAKNYTRSTPLHEAASAGHVAAVEVLLRRDQDRVIVDIQDEDGHTALHNAAYEGHAEVIRILLENGANPTIKTKFYKTALDLANKRGYKAAAELLVSV
ncbi:Ankyrin-1 [Dactylella cylindrospora]|nr:Ankyrin-1 [Dactylella cylindrospora]